MTVEWRRGTTGSRRIPRSSPLDVVESLLGTSYWAADRLRETIQKSIRHSLCCGLYWGEKQVGFARAVTDHATFYWLCDVVVDEAHRGHGLGKWLVECMVTTPELEGRVGLLATRDAQGLYERYGFTIPEDPSRVMWLRPANRRGTRRGGPTSPPGG
jgi:GNAT superfamily N-acetyltransferase